MVIVRFFFFYYQERKKSSSLLSRVTQWFAGPSLEALKVDFIASAISSGPL